MADEIKQNITEQSTWVRAFYMIIFFVIYSVAEAVLAAVIIFQFLSKLLTLKLNKKLLKFGADLSKFAYDILMFLTYNTDEKPFPFSEWSGNTDVADSSTVTAEPGSKTSVKKRSTRKSKVTRITKEKSKDDDDGQNSSV